MRPELFHVLLFPLWDQLTALNSQVLCCFLLGNPFEGFIGAHGNALLNIEACYRANVGIGIQNLEMRGQPARQVVDIVVGIGDDLSLRQMGDAPERVQLADVLSGQDQSVDLPILVQGFQVADHLLTGAVVKDQKLKRLFCVFDDAVDG